MGSTTDTIWRGTRGPRDARYMIVGEAWGSDEAAQGKPFVGYSGQELSRILREARIPETSCFFTNVINERPRANNMYEFFYPTKDAQRYGRTATRGLYPMPNVVYSLDLLEKQIATICPAVIIAFGNYPLWALTKDNFGVGNVAGRKVPTGIADWRGSQLRHRTTGTPVLPTYHPTAALRNWPWRYLIKHDLAVRTPLAVSNQWDEPERRFLVAPTFDEAIAALAHILTLLDSAPTPIAIDIETRASHISCIGFAWSTADAVCIPLMSVLNSAGYWPPSQEIALVHAVRRILLHPNLILRGQNFLYDAQYIFAEWLAIPHIAQDTRIMHHLCYPGTGSKPSTEGKRPGGKDEGAQNLNYISSMYCAYHRYWKEDGRNWDPSKDERIYWTYNCRDCVITWEAAAVLDTVIDHCEQRPQFDIQTRQLQSILRMMLRGVLTDAKRREEVRTDLAATTREYQLTLEHMVPGDVLPRMRKAAAWYDSPTKTAELFYDLLNLPVQLNPKTKTRTVDDFALEALKMCDRSLHSLFETLQQYRSLRAFKKFVDMETDHFGRLRSSYSPTAETFRWTSSKDAWGRGGNLQNLPKGVEDD